MTYWLTLVVALSGASLSPGAPPVEAAAALGVVLTAPALRATVAADPKKRKKTTKAKPKKAEAPPEATNGGGATAPTPPAAPEPPLARVLPDPRPLPKGHKAVAVLPLLGIDAPFEIIQEVEHRLLDEVDETQGMRSIAPGDVRADTTLIGLDPDKCEGEVTCLARAGRHAGGHLAIETRVMGLGGALSVSLRLVDAENGAELGRVAEPMSDDPTIRAAELHRYAVQLLTPGVYVGALRLKASQDGAEVYLDDKRIGTTPMNEPLKGLRAGPHILRITKTGFADLYQFVDVVYNRTATVEVDLSTNTLVGVLVETESQSGVGQVYVAATESGLEIRVDGEPRGSTILNGPIANVPAGKRRISVRKPGFEPVVREIEVAAGRRTDISVTRVGTLLVAASVEIVDAAAPLPSGVVAVTPQGGLGTGGTIPLTRTWRFGGGLGIAGAGLVGLAVGAYGASRVSSLNAETRSLTAGLSTTSSGAYACANLGLSECQARSSKLRSLARDAGRAETLEVVGFAAGGALLVTGGALVLWELMRAAGAPANVPANAPETVLTLTPAEGGAVVGLALAY